MRKNIQKTKDTDKKARISAEIERLSTVFSDLDDAHQTMAKNLIQNSAFMMVTLQDLQGVIDSQGTNFANTEQSANIAIYNKLVVNYTASIKVLSGMLGKNQSAAKQETGLTDFMLRKK